MRYIISVGILFCVAGAILFSCNKWKDPAPVNDPRLTNPYCNDPDAVNYNWGFPGKPDNTICFYPADLFKGTYLYKDSAYIDSNGLFIGADSFYLNISRLSNKKIQVGGFCSNGNLLVLTAGVTYDAVLDTNAGDTTTLHLGQLFCRTVDTVTGTITRDRVDSSLIRISFRIVNDTGITVHSGSARKQ